MGEKTEKWLKCAVICETALLFAASIAALVFLAVTLIPVLSEPIPKGFVDMAIHAYPDKLYYIVGEDTSLDLSGGSVCFDIAELDNKGFSCVQAYENHDHHDAVPMAECSFRSDIDFTQEGRYYVWFSEHMGDRDVVCGFPVDVIAPPA